MDSTMRKDRFEDEGIAGEVGFEPTNAGSRVRRLTTCRLPKGWRGRARTCDLRNQSPTSYQLDHSPMLHEKPLKPERAWWLGLLLPANEPHRVRSTMVPMDAQDAGSKESPYEENPDEVVAKDAFGIFKRSFRTAIAAAGVAFFFFFRSRFGCEPESPEGIEFEWHGNHCGPGHGDPDAPAKDDLDKACKKHDAAYDKSKSRSQDG